MQEKKYSLQTWISLIWGHKNKIFDFWLLTVRLLEINTGGTTVSVTSLIILGKKGTHRRRISRQGKQHKTAPSPSPPPPLSPLAQCLDPPLSMEVFYSKFSFANLPELCIWYSHLNNASASQFFLYNKMDGVIYNLRTAHQSFNIERPS